MMPMPNTPYRMSAPSAADDVSSGGRLVSADGRTLPLRGTDLRVEAQGGIARAVLRQRFVNPHAEPLSVRYLVPLPADGAVSAFSFTLGDKRIVGEIDKKDRARQRYEEAIVEGKSAALLEQDRSSLFTQDVGNIPPGAEVVSELVVDQKLRWLSDGRWEWRFPTVVAPRYMGHPGRVGDAAHIEVPVSEAPLEARAQLALSIGDRLIDGGRPESTSHPIDVVGGRVTDVCFRDGAGARLDRDVVVSWPVAAGEARCELVQARPPADHPHGEHSFGLLTLVPPRLPMSEVARDLILLIDTSGSMGGEPLDQARRLALALVDTLGARDTLQMIEFSWRASKWQRAPQRATEEVKRDARKWLGGLSASGGTEMHSGILAALDSLRDDAQRQVVVMSDGLIGFEHEIVQAIATRLPPNCRVHMVGVGSAVNRSLTMPCARAGRGVEAIIGIGEDPERMARRLVAHTASPIVVDVTIGGSALVAHAPLRAPDLYAGAPALIALQVRAGTLEVSGRTPEGPWRQSLRVDDLPHAHGSQALVKLFAREQVEDLEVQHAVDPGDASIDGRIEALGLSYQVASRLTSWVAVSDAQTVDPGAPSLREEIPHALPHGMSIQGLGLRGRGGVVAVAAAMPAAVPLGMAAPLPRMAAYMPGPPPPQGGAMPPRPAPAAPPARQAPGRLKKGEAFGGAPEDADDEGVFYAASAPPPEPAKRKIGLMDRLAEGVRSLLSPDAPEAADEEEARARVAMPARMQAPLAISGRVVLAGDDSLTIEITAWTELSWAPHTLRLTLSDGSEREVVLDAQRSTTPARVPAGRILRLTVRWTGGALPATPSQLTLTSDGERLTVSL